MGPQTHPRQVYGTLQNHGSRRPGTAKQIEGLVVRMAKENRDWVTCGYRVRSDESGHQVVRGTIANILRRHGY